MADEDKTKDEEIIEEESPDETLDAIKAFDALNDGDDDDSAEEADDDGEEEAANEETPAKEEAADETVVEDSMDAKVDALEKEIEAESGKSDEQKATEKAAADAKATAEAEAAKKDEELPFDCGLSSDPDSEDSYEPKLVEVLNKQGQALQDRAKDAEAKNEALESKIDRQASQRECDWLDRKFDKLPDSFGEALGKGEFEDLEPGSVQRANRMAISKRMSVTIRAYVKAKKPIPTRSTLFKMAVDKLHSTETKKSNTDKKTVGKLKKRAEQTLGGGSKKGSARQAGSRVIKALKDFDKKIDG